jgi:V/A-type H+-transporting ATPase subunit E
MSPEQDNIQVLKSAIMEEAREEASRILADAEAQAENIRQQAEGQAEAEREAILQQARREAEALHGQAAATAQLEARTLKLKRREQLLERVFTSARQKLAAASEWPDYDQIVRRLVREAVAYLDASEVLVRIAAGTQRVLDEEALADLGRELGVHLHTGAPLAQSTGVVVETPDGHRRYDNTLETRLARMKDVLRTAVYHILMGETP